MRPIVTWRDCGRANRANTFIFDIQMDSNGRTVRPARPRGWPGRLALAARLAVTAALAVAALPAAGRDLFTDTLGGYTIEKAILDAPSCAGPAFDDVTLQAFEQGLCLFHRPARSPADTARAIALLGQAQTRGLPPVHQQLASLATGLAQCAEAGRHLDAYRASGNQSLLERTLFCRDRRLAQAELNAIRWNQALFDYAEGLAPQRSLDARFTEMSACHAGPLSADFDAECGLISNLTDTEINAFVDGATNEVIATYFSGVESPITAMLARKLTRAEGLVGTAEAGIADLEESAAVVNSEYEALNGVYEGARDSKMAPIYDAYRQSILKATAILDEFDRWKGGLFITSENVNLLPKIAERADELEGELTRTRELAFRDKAVALTDDIRRVIRGEAADRETVAALCRVYFCELTTRRAMPGVIRACSRPALAGNPLCIGQDGAIKSGVVTVDFEGRHSVDIATFCRGAGVDPAFTAVDLTPGNAAACLSQMP